MHQYGWACLQLSHALVAHLWRHLIARSWHLHTQRGKRFRAPESCSSRLDQPHHHNEATTAKSPRCKGRSPLQLWGCHRLQLLCCCRMPSGRPLTQPDACNGLHRCRSCCARPHCAAGWCSLALHVVGSTHSDGGSLRCGADLSLCGGTGPATPTPSLGSTCGKESLARAPLEAAGSACSQSEAAACSRMKWTVQSEVTQWPASNLPLLFIP